MGCCRSRISYRETLDFTDCHGSGNAATLSSLMLPLRINRLQHESIAWLVIAAVLVLALTPHHYHLHHGSGADSVAHEHVIDLHLFSDVSDAAHHDEAIVLEATPDGLLKPASDNPLTLPLTIFRLAFLPIIDARIRHRLYDSAARLRTPLYHLTPPLRAPPQQ